MTVGELLKELAKAPKNAELSLITSRDSKWDGIFEVEIFNDSVHLLGSSSWKAREQRELEEQEEE